MGQWIGDRAEEAVQALSSRVKELEREVEVAHIILDAYDVPRYEEQESQGRPYTLNERIKINHEKNRGEIMNLVGKIGEINSTAK